MGATTNGAAGSSDIALWNGVDFALVIPRIRIFAVSTGGRRSESRSCIRILWGSVAPSIPEIVLTIVPAQNADFSAPWIRLCNVRACGFEVRCFGGRFIHTSHFTTGPRQFWAEKIRVLVYFPQGSNLWLRGKPHDRSATAPVPVLVEAPIPERRRFHSTPSRRQTPRTARIAPRTRAIPALAPVSNAGPRNVGEMSARLLSSWRIV